MSNLIEVIIDDLNKVSYTFTSLEYYGTQTIFLDTMNSVSRKTKRHGWVIDLTKSYSRIFGRDHGIKEEPDIPFEVAADAVLYFRNLITFKKWTDR